MCPNGYVVFRVNLPILQRFYFQKILNIFFDNYVLLLFNQCLLIAYKLI